MYVFSVLFLMPTRHSKSDFYETTSENAQLFSFRYCCWFFFFFFVFFFFNIQSLLYMSEYFMIIRGGGHVFFREHVRGNQYIIVGEITYNKSYEIT